MIIARTALGLVAACALAAAVGLFGALAPAATVALLVVAAGALVAAAAGRGLPHPGAHLAAADGAPSPELPLLPGAAPPEDVRSVRDPRCAACVGEGAAPVTSGAPQAAADAGDGVDAGRSILLGVTTGADRKPIAAAAVAGVAVVGEGPAARSVFRALVADLRARSCRHAVVRLVGEPTEDEHLVPLAGVDAAAGGAVRAGGSSLHAVAVSSVSSVGPGPGRDGHGNGDAGIAAGRHAAGHRAGASPRAAEDRRHAEGTRLVRGCVVWSRRAPPAAVGAVVELGPDGCHVRRGSRREPVVPVLALLRPP